MSLQRSLVITTQLWGRLILCLRNRGQGYRESGAFLLGNKIDDELDVVNSFVAYDDLDPEALNSGIIKFDSSGFANLWTYCRRRQARVLADIHTHPGDAYQSNADKLNPMISESGHIALIVPRFAQNTGLSLESVGIYEYLKNYEWRSWIRNSRNDRVILIDERN